MSTGFSAAWLPAASLGRQALAENREQLRKGYVECFGKPPDVDQRGIALAAFDTAHVCPVEPGPVRQLLLRELQAVPEFAHPLAKGQPEVVHGQDRGTKGSP